MKKSRLVPIGFCALAVMWMIHFTANHIHHFGSIGGHTVAATQGPSALVRSLRPSYPYSIIAGGAYSPQELRYAHGKDAVVRDHYADFDIAHAKVVRLTDDRFQYVSYRLKNQVYWTKKKLKVPSGELLLTDGVQYARARCGNRLSDKPHQAAVSPHEPENALLNLPPISLDLLPRLALADPPVARAAPNVIPLAVPADPSVVAAWPAAEQPLVPLVPVWGGQPFVPGATGPGGYVSSTPSTPATGPTVSPISPNTPGKPDVPSPALVPEPSSVYLFLITMLFTGWVLLRLSPRDGDQEQSNKQH